MDIENTVSNERLNKAILVNAMNNSPIPDYFGRANWAYTKPIRKFINKLPGLDEGNINDLGQYIPVAVPDETTYSGSDYYEIAVVEFTEKMHTDLTKTTLRGYVQLSTNTVTGKQISLKYNGVQIKKSDGSDAIAVDNPHYMGPMIIANKNKPVRIKFYNLLPTGSNGNLFIPVDTTVMGAGMGPLGHAASPMNYTQNRADIHLHGNNSVWISDGTPHQWITPANEDTPYPKGVSVRNVPDMDVRDDNNMGMQTLYYTNAQSARLMFYHDHSYGITRLNVYAGEASPYILTDEVEQDLINRTNNSGVNPNFDKVLPDLGIPLVIQDKTFVDSATISDTDPTWIWGTVTDPNEASTGDLWYPHVYSPAQNPWAEDGVNPYGRWMYGPWFWPPTTNVKHQPIPNPYYIDPVSTPNQPPMTPDMPFPSMPGEAFMDTPIVNGTAYPYLTVEPRAYRFRILNAADDRFFNLQLYEADTTGYISPYTGYPTEVKTIPVCGTPGIPADWPPKIPDPNLAGPSWIQIGTESGFLPEPVIVPNQPITWNLNATTFNAGNVDKHSLLLGTAERADVIVDFSQYAGKALILYNDAPAAFPAADLRYDYYTGNDDLRGEGGAPPTQEGYGPNTRTIMQIRVNALAPGEIATAYDFELLKTVFKKSKVDNKKGVFEASHDTIIIPQSAYKSAYDIDDANLPTDVESQYIQLQEFSKTFRPINKDGMLLDPVTLQIEPKALQDEMGEVYDLGYGRMSGMLGLEFPVTSSNFNNFIVYGFPSPPVEVIKGTKDLETTVIGSLDDGTQIWKITHNGVDTHTIHTHLYSVQLINRVAWDGAMMPPDPNELGWKETFRVNPLEHTVIALRPNIPDFSKIPFKVPNSIRLIDPTMMEGDVLEGPPPNGWFDPLGNPIAEVRNHYVNYGWEYVYHCHILAHEEMDMMHSVAFAVPLAPPSNLTGNVTGNGSNISVILNWIYDNIYGAVQIVQRKINSNGQWIDIGIVPAGTTTYTNVIGNAKNNYYYRVFSRVIVGDETISNFPTVTMNSDFTNEILIAVNPVLIPNAPTNLTLERRPGTGGVRVYWQDNSTNETAFIIERSTNGGNFVVIGTSIGAGPYTGSRFYTDRTVNRNNVYAYRVRATNDAGYSDYSNTATIRY